MSNLIYASYIKVEDKYFQSAATAWYEIDDLVDVKATELALSLEDHFARELALLKDLYELGGAAAKSKQAFENAVEKVCAIRSGTGRYLTDDESVSRSFLIAQDVQKVLPEAVTIQNDEIGTLGLSYTEVVPLLVAAIKELNAKVDAQAARIAALETK